MQLVVKKPLKFYTNDINEIVFLVLKKRKKFPVCLFKNELILEIFQHKMIIPVNVNLGIQMVKKEFKEYIKIYHTKEYVIRIYILLNICRVIDLFKNIKESTSFFNTLVLKLISINNVVLKKKRNYLFSKIENKIIMGLYLTNSICINDCATDSFTLFLRNGFFSNKLKKNNINLESDFNLSKIKIKKFRGGKIFIKLKNSFLELLLFYFPKKSLFFLDTKVYSGCFFKSSYRFIEEETKTVKVNLIFRNTKQFISNVNHIKNQFIVIFFFRKIYFYFFYWKLQFNLEVVFFANLFKKSLWLLMKANYLTTKFNNKFKEKKRKLLFFSAKKNKRFFILKFGFLIQKHPYSLIIKSRFLSKLVGSYCSLKNRSIIKLWLNDIQCSNHYKLLSFLILFLDLIFSAPKIKNIFLLISVLIHQDSLNSIDFFKIPQNMEKFLNFAFFKNLFSQKLLFSFIIKNGFSDLYRKWVSKIILYSNLKDQLFWYRDWSKLEIEGQSFYFLNKKKYFHKMNQHESFLNLDSLHMILFRNGRWDLLFKILCENHRFLYSFHIFKI
jgi:hypothetical protein